MSFSYAQNPPLGQQIWPRYQQWKTLYLLKAPRYQTNPNSKRAFLMCTKEKVNFGALCLKSYPVSFNSICGLLQLPTSLRLSVRKEKYILIITMNWQRAHLSLSKKRQNIHGGEKKHLVILTDDKLQLTIRHSELNGSYNHCKNWLYNLLGNRYFEMPKRLVECHIRE